MEYLHTSEDSLEPLPNIDLVEYKDIYARNLPKYLSPYNFLLMQLRWKQMLNENNENLSKHDLKLFRPRKCDKKCCTFIAAWGVESADIEHFVYAFTLENPPNELVNSISNTKYIDWARSPSFFLIMMEIAPFIQTVLEEKNLSITEMSEGANCFWLSKEKAKNLNRVIPDEYYMDNLTVDHIDLLNDQWKYKTEKTRPYIETLIKLNKGMGLFSKKDKKLLCWISLIQNFAVGFLRTIESERKKGLAKLLLCSYCQHLAQSENVDIIGNIEFDNIPSIKLFQSIGFEIFGRIKSFQALMISKMRNS